MDIEARLRILELQYRSTLSAAVAAKARYLALAGESSSTPAAILRAKGTWENLAARRAGIVAQIHALEELEQTLV
ncbi:MAG: hypothetical protein M3O26_20225 [Pseudomonadota bacterium]|nr:hypothetical protein [Pseudomonadota bacterium]